MGNVLPPPGAEWEFDGVTYTVPGEVNYDAEDAFSDWLRRDTYRQLERDRKEMGEEWFARMERGLRADIAAHQYDFGDPISRACLTTPAGLVQLGIILIRQARGKPPPDLQRRLRQDVEARDRLVLLVWEALDPKTRGWLRRSEQDQPSTTTPPPASENAATGSASLLENSAADSSAA